MMSRNIKMATEVKTRLQGAAATSTNPGWAWPARCLKSPVRHRSLSGMLSELWSIHPGLPVQYGRPVLMVVRLSGVNNGLFICEE